jgi:hypothetical protein
VHVCERLGFEVLAMEEFGPDPRQAVDVCREKVRRADVFLGLYAHRYGHTIEELGGKSITELEYEWAREREVPVVLFLVDQELPWPPKHVDKGPAAEQLETLKARLRARHVVAPLTTPEQLRDDLFVHLPPFGKPAEPAEERPRAIPLPPEAYVAHPYTLLQTRQVVGRAREIELLDDWVADPAGEHAAVRVFCLVAIGGMGKSALSWKWFHERAAAAPLPWAGWMWWSFYESDAGFDRFVAAALAYVSARSRAAVDGMSAGDRENELLAVLDQAPFLLCLDGLERILIAYANLDFAHLADDDLDQRTANRVAGARGLPASAGESFVGQHRLRRTIDARAGNFLRKLTRSRASRILVTTRLYPSELQTVTGAELPGSAAWFLRGLQPEDALALWRAMGVSGSDVQLGALFATFDHYPLLIRALACEVARFRRAPGDFDAWRSAHPRFDPYQLPLTQVKSHVLEQALDGLDERERELLHTVAAFRAPIGYETLAALLDGTSGGGTKGSGCPTAQAEIGQGRGRAPGPDRRDRRASRSRHRSVGPIQEGRILRPSAGAGRGPGVGRRLLRSNRWL